MQPYPKPQCPSTVHLLKMVCHPRRSGISVQDRAYGVGLRRENADGLEAGVPLGRPRALVRSRRVWPALTLSFPPKRGCHGYPRKYTGQTGNLPYIIANAAEPPPMRGKP